MSELLKRLNEQRLNAWEQAKGIAETASNEEGRSFTAEEQTSWDAAMADMNSLDQRISQIQEAEERAAKQSEFLDRSLGRDREERGAGGTEGSDRGAAVRAFLKGESNTRSFDITPAQGGSIWERRSAMAGVELRDTALTKVATSSYTVPTDFYDRLVEHLIQVSAVLQTKPTVINTAAGEPIQVPKTTAHPLGSLVAEGASISAGTTDPTFGQVTLGAYKYGTLLQLSRELLDDSGVDIEGYIARACGRALGNAIGTNLVTGTGTNQPQGVVTGATSGLTSASVGVIGGDDLINLMYSIIPPYRNSPSCAWMMSDASLGKVRLLKDNQGRYLFEPSLQVGTPDVLLGKPIVIDYNMAGVATGNKPVLFGDFSTYFVRFSGGVRLERSVDYAFDTDLISFRALLRGDGKLVDLTGSLKYITVQ